MSTVPGVCSRTPLIIFVFGEFGACGVASGEEQHQSVKRVFAQCSVFQRTPENHVVPFFGRWQKGFNFGSPVVDCFEKNHRSSDAAMILALAPPKVIV